MSNNQTIILSDQFKALSNTHRLALFQRLFSCCTPGTTCSTEEAARLTVGQLGEGIEIAPSTISHHMKELHRAGLIKMKRKGKQIECWVDPETLENVASFFTGIPAVDNHDTHRQNVRKTYTKIANNKGTSCCSGSNCCTTGLISSHLGYSKAELEMVPSGADMGLGCGNPKAIAALKPGEIVVDLGSGGGFDCFLAANEVGKSGYVIGVDMTPDMVSKARLNAEKGKYTNVDFRLGEIEHLPIADKTADVIISNCVINLSPDKQQVFNEAFRILKPGGRLAISDVVATAQLPETMRSDLGLISGCMGNASLIDDIEKMIFTAGFEQVCIQPKDESKEFIREWAPEHNVTNYVVSATIEAVKPV